jgi:hypothetical protein
MRVLAMTLLGQLSKNWFQYIASLRWFLCTQAYSAFDIRIAWHETPGFNGCIG